MKQIFFKKIILVRQQCYIIIFYEIKNQKYALFYCMKLFSINNDILLF